MTPGRRDRRRLWSGPFDNMEVRAARLRFCRVAEAEVPPWLDELKELCLEHRQAILRDTEMYMESCVRAKGKPIRIPKGTARRFEFPESAKNLNAAEAGGNGLPPVLYNPGAPALNRAIRSWADKWSVASERSGCVEGEWLLDLVKMNLKLWAHSDGGRERMKLRRRGYSGSYSSSQSDHPTAMFPSGLDWSVAARAGTSRTRAAVVFPVPRGAGARRVPAGGAFATLNGEPEAQGLFFRWIHAGWDPTQETEQQFRERVENYINDVIQRCGKYGLHQCSASRVRQEAHFVWLARWLLLRESAETIAANWAEREQTRLGRRGKVRPLKRQTIEEAVENLRSYLGLPRRPQARRGRKRK